MSERILLYGATGYTGRLVAAALAGLDLPVTLAGRDETALAELRAERGQSETWLVAVADSARPASVRALVDRDCVVVAAAGPFTRVGWPVAEAAAATGAAYLDCSGEPPFLRRLVDELRRPATASRGVLAPAFGYDFVPGQIAAAHALRHAPTATGVRVGYFVSGAGAKRWLSGGTRASMAAVVAEPSYAWRRWQLRTERSAARVHSMAVAGNSLTGMSIGGAEHLFLPRSFPQLRDVDVYLGWAGAGSRLVQVASGAVAPVLRLPAVRNLAARATQRFVRGSSGGPSVDDRARTGSLVVAEALADDGAVACHVELRGPNPYELTAALLAFAAGRLLENRAAAPIGVVGPLELFGTDGALELAEQAGLRRSV